MKWWLAPASGLAASPAPPRGVETWPVYNETLRIEGDRGHQGPALRKFAPIFAALGDETLLRLIAVLCAGGALSIAQLTTGTDITRQAITKHLHVLADDGLVNDVKVGRERRWEFEPTQLEEARRSLEVIAQQWDHALKKLKVAVEA